MVDRTARNFGISVMLSTHLMGDVERIADSVLVLESGVLSQEGAVASLTQETEALIIEVAEGVDAFAAILAERGVEANADGNLLVIEHAKEEDYDVVRDAAVDAGARLRRLAPARRTLTDIFRGGPS